MDEDQVAPVDEREVHDLVGDEEGHDDVGVAMFVEVDVAIRFEGQDEVGGAIVQVDPVSLLGEAAGLPGGPGSVAGGKNSWSWVWVGLTTGEAGVQVVKDGTEVHAEEGGAVEDQVEIGVEGEDHVDVGGGDAVADQTIVRNRWKLATGSSAEVSGVEERESACLFKLVGETRSPRLNPRIKAAAHSSERRWVAPREARLGKVEEVG